MDTHAEMENHRNWLKVFVVFARLVDYTVMDYEFQPSFGYFVKSSTAAVKFQIWGKQASQQSSSGAAGSQQQQQQRGASSSRHY